MKHPYLLVCIFLLSFSSRAQVAPITGTPVVCQFATTSLSDATPAGTWSSSITTIAVVGSSGIVTGVLPGTATITYAAGLTYATATVTVSPPPVLTSPVTAPAICDSMIFSYIPTSSTPGVIFNWSRGYVPGIDLSTGSGMDNPDEQLINTTDFYIAVTYIYTLTAGGCTNTANVTVTVNPTPRLSSALTAAVCDSVMFNYIPASITPGTTYTWMRNVVAGISNPASSGSGSIHETLNGTTFSAVTVPYYFTLTVDGCMHNGDIMLTVNPCSLKVPQANLSESKIYPDPGNGTFTTYFPSVTSEQVTLSIINTIGEIVREIVTTTNTITEVKLDVPAGVYFLSATTAENKFYSRIIVDR